VVDDPRSSERDKYGSLVHLANAEEILSRIGWIEGLGRVQEQYACHWRAESIRAEARIEQDRARELAVRQARIARSFYERIRLERLMGRMDSLLEQIDGSSFSPIS
jgi:hypothetical protein